MLRLVRTYSRLDKAKWKSGGSMLLILLMLLSAFSPVITLMTFRTHIDEHVAACQQRGHDNDCQAGCILAEMMPEQTEVLAKYVSHAVYFFPVLLFQHHLPLPGTWLEGASAVRYFFYLKHYSSPVPEIPNPPPLLG